MAARGGRSRDRTGTRTRREAGAGRWLEPALVLTRELVLLAGTLTVLVAFCRPWLVVETAPLAEALLGLPASESLPAWRLPGYARRVDQAWVVAVVQLFGSDQPDPGRLWLIWLSPGSALVAWALLRSRRRPAALATVLIQAFLALFLADRFLEGLEEQASAAIEAHYGDGVLLAILGHGLLALIALRGLPGRRRGRGGRGRP
ncbi:MAG: hypothetical protein H6807_11585 [Planctomycetes bacterium]|nr:hypothetical protein [Planctomycetota bacterium]